MGMTEAARRSGYAQLALELREKREQAAREAEEKVEVVATFGSGIKSLTARSLADIGDRLLEDGYRMDKAKPRYEGDMTQLIVPHRDGFKQAIVKVRRRK